MSRGSVDDAHFQCFLPDICAVESLLTVPPPTHYRTQHFFIRSALAMLLNMFVRLHGYLLISESLTESECKALMEKLACIKTLNYHQG